MQSPADAIARVGNPRVGIDYVVQQHFPSIDAEYCLAKVAACAESSLGERLIRPEARVKFQIERGRATYRRAR